jgi:hypothetical protein
MMGLKMISLMVSIPTPGVAKKGLRAAPAIFLPSGQFIGAGE